ncbi:MAG: alpha-galactosidase [Lachnospiraceae bacterium]|nr:alpha-galactosidase [Lachnospiraceae bacterium]
MIEILNHIFSLHTAHTSYVFHADVAGKLLHLYYGEKISINKQVIQALLPKQVNQNGCSIIADASLPTVCLDDSCLEASSRGQGDLKEPFVEIEYNDYSRSSDFRYEGYRIENEKSIPNGLAGAYGTAQTLVICLEERFHNIRMELFYSIFEECDCITRYARLINNGKEDIKITRLMSAQLDTQAFEWKITSFHGDWTREMNRYDMLLQAGKYVNDSMTGFSSNKSNPFVMFGEADTGEDYGNCYACNLIYSGNHRTSFESSGHGKFRMLTGINPDFFSWILKPTDCFDAPECVLTYSANGYQDISLHMHTFVREHIVRGTWKYKERPILLNSWEACYFKVQEQRVLKLAKAASEVGIELFVLDDGWFGKRDSDNCSLGDWYDNQDKLPGGLSELSRKIRALGMSFGIWVEPEMVNEDSDLYRAHPEWAVQIPNKTPSLGRNQLLLDLTNPKVQDYLIESMSNVFTRSKVSYVKWDMNRHMSDYYSQTLSKEHQGEFAHRYILGLYHILEVLTQRFPEILFEACASGGNRFDLGMLCYMPQIWASDCTDAIGRGIIQNGYSYGYPQSVWSAHVSACPNHQTLRNTPLETRFAVASVGILGYECNLCDANAQELAQIKEQITLYKDWRRTLQFGQLYRLRVGNGCAYGCLTSASRAIPYHTDIVHWNIVSQDKSKAVGITLQGLVTANFSHHQFRAKGLANEKTYHFYNRILKYDVRRMGDLINTLAPIHIKQDSCLHHVIAKYVKLDGETEDYTVPGSILNKAGVQLAQSYAGTGYAQNTALYQDFDARMYLMEAVEES